MCGTCTLWIQLKHKHDCFVEKNVMLSWKSEECAKYKALDINFLIVNYGFCYTTIKSSFGLSLRL